MKLESFIQKNEGRYLNQYELTYHNKEGNSKKYEMVSRTKIQDPSQIGQVVSGVSIIAYQEGKMLLLKEFRMSLNRSIYNLCAGMVEADETLEECVARELYEETGLFVKKVIAMMPPAFDAVGISDIKTVTVWIETKGSIADHTSQNEEIKATFFDKKELSKMLQTEEFSAKAQLAAYYFLNT